MSGVRFKTFEQNGRKLRLVEFARGFKEPDWCRKGHIGYVLEGEAELRFSERTIPLKAGDGIFIPAGEEHKHLVHVSGAGIRVVLVEELQAQ
jgi:quercetin dioxygenase-like cupin family protein